MTVRPERLLPFLLTFLLSTLWRPRSVLLLPLVFHVVYRVRATLSFGALILPTTLLEILLVVAFAVGMVAQRGQVVRSVLALPRTVRAVVVLFLCAATVSAAIAPHPRTAWGQWKAFVVEPMAYVAVLLPLLQAPETRALVGRALLLGGVVSATASLAGGASCVWPTLFPRDFFVCPLTADFGRLLGVYDVPNSLALVLAPLTVLGSVLAVSAEASSLRRAARWSLFATIPGLLLTQSSAGLLATAGALGVVSWRWSRDGKRFVFLFVALVGVGVLLQAASGKLLHSLGENSPLAARRQIWSVSFALLREHPLLGTGLGTFEPAYQAKLRELLRSSFLIPSSQPLEWVVRDPHNLILSFWLNTGLLGLVAMVGLVAFALARRGSAPVPTTDGRLLSAARAALLALLFFGLVDVPYFKNDLSLLWWVLTALILSVSLSQAPRERTTGPQGRW